MPIIQKFCYENESKLQELISFAWNNNNYSNKNFKVELIQEPKKGNEKVDFLLINFLNEKIINTPIGIKLYKNNNWKNGLKQTLEYMRRFNSAIGFFIICVNNIIDYNSVKDFININKEDEQTLFENVEINGYLEKNMLQAKKNIFDHVIYDSNIEKTWAEKMESNKDIILYTKLPSWFKINTPLGSYNPDWAILVNAEDKNTKLYFVVETKGNINEETLRPTELQKIKCGKAHFKAIGSNVKLEVRDDFNSFIEEAKLNN